MDNKIKIPIAFDPTGYWSNLFYREFIDALVADEQNYEVYLITLNTDTSFINDVANEIDLDSANISQLATNSAVSARLNTLKCLIYLTEDNVLCNFVNSTIPIQLNANNVTGCQALVLNNIVDPYRVQQKFITNFHFWVDQINRQY